MRGAGLRSEPGSLPGPRPSRGVQTGWVWSGFRGHPASGLGGLRSTAILQPRAGGAQVGTLSPMFSHHPDALDAGTKRPSFAKPRRGILKWEILPKWDYWRPEFRFKLPLILKGQPVPQSQWVGVQEPHAGSFLAQRPWAGHPLLSEPLMKPVFSAEVPPNPSSPTFQDTVPQVNNPSHPLIGQKL